MSNNDEETFWVRGERCVHCEKISDSKGRKEHENQETKRAVTDPSRKAVLAGRPIWPMKTMIPTTRHIGGKEGKKGKKGHRNSSIL